MTNVNVFIFYFFCCGFRIKPCNFQITSTFYVLTSLSNCCCCCRRCCIYMYLEHVILISDTSTSSHIHSTYQQKNFHFISIRLAKMCFHHNNNNCENQRRNRLNFKMINIDYDFIINAMKCNK